MTLAVLLFISAFLLEGVASYLSIVGLVATFTMSISIIVLAIALDCAKLTAVAFMYKHWDRLHLGMKLYLLPAVFVLMTITAIGSYGYLMEHFQNSIQTNKEISIQLESMIEEKNKLEARKKEIDAQIANLPPNFVSGRKRLQDQFKSELDHLNKRTIELDSEIPKIKTDQVVQDSHIGPIAVMASVMGVSLEVAIQYVVLLIVAVMDPLAIVLILAGNKLLMIKEEDDADLIEAEKRQRLAEIERDTERTHLETKIIEAEEDRIEDILEDDIQQCIEKREDVFECDRSEPEVIEQLEEVDHITTLEEVIDSVVEEPVDEQLTYKERFDKIFKDIPSQTTIFNSGQISNFLSDYHKM